MKRKFVLKLNSLDVGQLLDGLRIRAESYRNTESDLRDGVSDDPFFIGEECTSDYEAGRIAEHYERIIETIEQQVAEQGGWSGQG